MIRERECKAYSRGDAVKEGFYRTVFRRERFRTGKDNAVYHDERDEQSEGRVYRGEIRLYYKLHCRDKAGDYNDIRRDSDIFWNYLTQKRDKQV